MAYTSISEKTKSKIRLRKPVSLNIDKNHAYLIKKAILNSDNYDQVAEKLCVSKSTVFRKIKELKIFKP